MREDIVSMYQSVKTYEDLLETNVKYLKGEIDETPYCVGSIHEETAPLVDNLVKLNKFGYYTMGGQPATRIYEKRIPTGSYKDWYYSAEQRPFVEGIIRYDPMMVPYLEKQGLYYYMSFQDGRACSNIPFGTEEYFNLTRNILDIRKETHSFKEWDSYTNLINMPMHNGVYGSFEEYPNIQSLLRPLVHLWVVGKDYGEDVQLEEKILAFLES